MATDSEELNEFYKWVEQLPTDINSYTRLGFALAAWRKAKKSERESCAKACEDALGYDPDDPASTYAEIIRNR